MYETLIVNGYNLLDYVTCIQSLDGMFTVGDPRGENVVIPGVDGEIWVDRPFTTGTVELGLYLRGTTQAHFNTGIRNLRLACSPGQPITIVRRMAFATGNEEHSARAQFAGGLQPSVALARFGRVTASFRLLDGVWYRNGGPTSVGVGGGATVTIPGEVRTHRMTVTMPSGSTLSNTTNGHTLSNNLGVGGAVVTVDVEKMTAVQGGVDVSGSLSWNKRFPMRLEAGPNTFSGPASTISYTPAFN